MCTDYITVTSRGHTSLCAESWRAWRLFSTWVPKLLKWTQYL